MDSNNNLEAASVGGGEKYKLRPRKRCAEELSGQEEEYCEEWPGRRRRGRSGSGGGGQAKSQPLSKYRRKTANARERSRMREINEAFDTLRRAVPTAGDGAERLTKISTLRLAMSYIAALSDVLASPQSQPQSPECSADCSLDCSSTLADPMSDLDDLDVFGPASLDFDDFLAIDIT